MPMYVLTVVAATTPDNPDHEKVGEAFVSCWIRRETEEEATAFAHKTINSGEWKVIRTEDVTVVTAETYEEDEEYRQYYEQALSDNEVFVFNLCPKYPVYRMTFEVTPEQEDDTILSAKVWVSNEHIDAEGDPMELDFWSGERVSKALNVAFEAIAESGHRILSLTEQCPCFEEDGSDDCQFFDDAEEYGLCVLIEARPTNE